MIDWASFAPGRALAGGLMIGAASALLILCTGRIAGISGIIGGLVRRNSSDEVTWRGAFLIGLVSAPFAYSILRTLPAVRIDAAVPELIVAGLLVGLGTRYGGGCTSGHGVCGLSRLSPRSLLATLTFMGAGFLTVFFTHHVFGG
jgi:uncharacterized membrane protein YedE/YeeE